MLSKGGNAKINLGEFFVFEVFLCLEAKHAESKERTLPFGSGESLRLPFLLTLAGTRVRICFCLHCRSRSAQSPWSDGQGEMGWLSLGSTSGFFSLRDFVLPSVSAVRNPRP